MLLVCNGAQKSGSTWLYNILTSLVECRSPERHYLTGNSNNPCIRPDMLAEFLQSADLGADNFISKNHLDKPVYRDLLVANDAAYVFDIERDPKDVVVSMFYDARNRHGYDRSFSKYYWTHAREMVAGLEAYHALWREAGPRCHVASYEGLKTDFPAQVRAIAAVLGITLTESDIGRLHAETSMDKLRKKYSRDALYTGEKFFRKGIVGDWENHFDESTLQDIESILKSGIRKFDRHHIAYRIRHWLNRRLGK